MELELLYLMSVVVAVGFVVLFYVLPRWGPHYTSKLVCPHCKKSFNFHWIPGGTINSLIYRNMRPLKCPYCHQKSIFDIATTRYRSPKKQSKAKSKA
jgi:hypothetical protein